MRRISTEHLAAAPQARETLELAQRCVRTVEDSRRDRPDLFGDDVNPRWMTDRRLPPGVRSAIVMAESASHLIESLTDDDLRILILPPGQMHELPEIPAADAWRQIAGGDRAPFPLMWIETPNFLVEVCAGANGIWESTGTNTKTHALLGFLIRDTDDYLMFQAVMREKEAVLDITRACGHDLSCGVKFVIPRNEHAFASSYLDGATVVARKVAEEGDRFVVEACQAFWERSRTGDPEIDRENGPLVMLTEGYLGPIAALLMLLSSVNVEMADARLDPTLPREQRRAVKRGAIPPKFIYIRQRASRSSGGDNKTGRKLTVRHEVRGHFKHYGPDTRPYQNAPVKLRRFDPERGWHVRFWTRPHVRGPVDAPLRILPRKVSESAPAKQGVIPNRSLENTKPPIKGEGG